MPKLTTTTKKPAEFSPVSAGYFQCLTILAKGRTAASGAWIRFCGCQVFSFVRLFPRGNQLMTTEVSMLWFFIYFFLQSRDAKLGPLKCIFVFTLALHLIFIYFRVKRKPLLSSIFIHFISLSKFSLEYRQEFWHTREYDDTSKTGIMENTFHMVAMSSFLSVTA